jgi:hypothetical protein
MCTASSFVQLNSQKLLKPVWGTGHLLVYQELLDVTALRQVAELSRSLTEMAGSLVEGKV